jgi:ArsR family transcriptional regulator
MQLKAMEETATRVSALLKLLSHRDRLMALCHLAQGEMSAGKLGEAVGMKAPAMSQQLAVLRREGIIAARREGQAIYYSIDDQDAVAIMSFLYERFCGDDDDGSASNAITPERETV